MEDVFMELTGRSVEDDERGGDASMADDRGY